MIHLDEFNKAYQSKNYKRMVELAKNLELTTENDLNRLAIAYREIGDFENAKKIYLKLTQTYPDSRLSYENFSYLYERIQNYQKSIEMWELVAEKFPTSTLAYWSMGNIYKNHLKDYDKAVEMYQKQIDRFPDRKSGYQGVAESLHDAKRYDEALVAWETVKQKYPDEPKSYWAIGQIYLEQQKYEKAEQSFQEQLSYFPNRESGLAGLKKIQQFKNGFLIEKDYQRRSEKILNTEISDFDYSEVIGIRTHVWTDEVAELYNILLSYFKPEQIFVVMEEMSNKPSVSVPQYINKISLNDKFLNDNQLLTTDRKLYHRGMGWLCGDYFYYVLMKNIKSEYYWLIEPDVRFTFSDMKAFFQRSHNYQNKNLLLSFGKASEKWLWYKGGKRIDNDVYACLFPFSRLTFKAVEVSLLERQKLTANILNYGLDIYHYPNDEVVVATSIKKHGFEVIDFKDIYGNKLYEFFSLSDIKTLPLSDKIPQGRIIHPARNLDYLGEKINQLLKKQLVENLDRHLVNDKSIFDLSQYISNKLKPADIYLAIRENQYANYQINDELSIIDNLYELTKLYQDKKDMETAENILIDINKLYPEYEKGYEKLANFYIENSDYQKAIKAWFLVTEKFPQSILAYWSMGNIYKNNLKDYDKAIEMYQKQIGRFPERKSGYQGVAESLHDAKRYDEALLAWEIVKQKYPDEPKSYWAIGQIHKEKQQYDFAEKEFLTLIEKFPNRESGYWNMAMLNFHLQNWAEAKLYWEKYFEKFKANDDVYYNYLKILINLNEDNILWCEKIANKIGKDKKDVLLKYTTFLRNYYKFSQLESVSKQLSVEYPTTRQFAEMYFMALYCQKKWLLAKQAYQPLISQFDMKANDLMFTYLDTLWHLKQYDDLEEHYITMLKKSYPQILEHYPDYDFLLDKLAIAETIGDFEKADKFRNAYSSPITTQSVKKPEFDEAIQCDYIHHSEENKALLIFFSGLTFKTKNNFDKNKFNDFEQLKQDNQDIQSSFIRFAQKNTQYNMLMINDIYNSWEQLHKLEYLNYIQNIIDKYKPQTVVCIGVSSGGYAAMLYGQLLKANLVFAFSPQTVPFFNYANYLGHLYKIHFSLGTQAQDSVIRLQNQQGFYAQTYIVVSEYNGMDLLGLNQLDKTDKNLQITYCKGYEHVPIQALGVKNVYQQMCLTIDNMVNQDNMAGINQNIFSDNPNFSYNQQ